MVSPQSIVIQKSLLNGLTSLTTLRERKRLYFTHHAAAGYPPSQLQNVKNETKDSMAKLRPTTYPSPQVLQQEFISSAEMFTCIPNAMQYRSLIDSTAPNACHVHSYYVIHRIITSCSPNNYRNQLGREYLQWFYNLASLYVHQTHPGSRPME